MISNTERKKSLRASLWDGVSWSLTVGFCETFLSPLSVALGAAKIYVGILSTLPQVIGDLTQLSTFRLIKIFGSRKKLIQWGVAAQAASLAIILFLPRLPQSRIALLLISTLLYWIAWMTITPAWQSWMGDLVPEETRGDYFSRRNRLVQVVTFAALLCGGFFLNQFSENDLSGFMILVSVGIAGRLISLLFITMQTDIPDASQNAPSFPLKDFLANLHRSNYGRFVIFMTSFAFAINISSSYFVPYALEEMKMGYAKFIVLMAIMALLKSLSFSLWGRLADKYGNLKLLVIACILMSVTPGLLCFSRDYIFMCGVQVWAGFAFSGFELCSFNFMLDGTPPETRTKNIAYYQVLTGVGIVIGAILGAGLLKFFSYGYLFAISSGIRILLCITLLPLLQEIRQVTHISYKDLLIKFVRFQKSFAE